MKEEGLSSAANSALLGGIIGAGIAYMRGRSVIRGAVDGASFGYFAEAVVSTVTSSLSDESAQHPFQRQGSGNFSGGGGAIAGRADELSGLSYEELLERSYACE